MNPLVGESSFWLLGGSDEMEASLSALVVCSRRLLMDGKLVGDMKLWKPSEVGVVATLDESGVFCSGGINLSAL